MNFQERLSKALKELEERYDAMSDEELSEHFSSAPDVIGSLLECDEVKLKFVEDLNVEDSWKEMEGNGNIEKKLNHYLTKSFIFSKDVPADECLHETQTIMRMSGADLEQQICRYIVGQFAVSKDFDKYLSSAKEIVKIINGN